EPPADVTTPMTSPPTPSPVVDVARWLSVPRLLPSWTLKHPPERWQELVMSATPAVTVALPPSVALSPEKSAPSLFDEASPVVTSVLSEVLLASIEVAPPETAR